MSSYWPTDDQQPNATPAEVECARNWWDTLKVLFSSTIDKVDWNTRLVTGGATLAWAAMRAGLIDEYVIAAHPVLVGGGTPFLTVLDEAPMPREPTVSADFYQGTSIRAQSLIRVGDLTCWSQIRVRYAMAWPSLVRFGHEIPVSTRWRRHAVSGRWHFPTDEPGRMLNHGA